MSTKTEASKLLAMLKARAMITAKQARDSGIRSPGARARELSEHGYPVVPCWQLLKPQKLERPAVTGRDGANADAIKPGKNSKPTSQAIAAELKRARLMVRHRPRYCRRKNDAMRLHGAGLLSDPALTQLFATRAHWGHE